MVIVTKDIQLERIQLGASHVYVVREDLLSGGTKERGAVPYLQHMKNLGFREFAYASPFSGFAQVALADACAKLHVRCKLFAVKDPAFANVRAHAYTRLAEERGASVVLTASLIEAEAAAKSYTLQNSSTKVLKVPLGFDDPVFREHLLRALNQQWLKITEQVPKPPRSLWVSLGSGTLAKTLRTVVPEEIDLHVVDVHVLKSSDQRIAAVRALPNVCYHSAAVEFAEPEFDLPPVPSNLYYDAKVWKTFLQNAKTGDLWWNVAR